MEDEKRTGQLAVPANLDEYVTDVQQLILSKIHKYGWSLKFVRRPSSEIPTVVIEDEAGKSFGVLEAGGDINFKSGIIFRAEETLKAKGGIPL